MSNQYLPKVKYDRAHEAVATTSGSGCPAPIAAPAEPYVRYSSWTTYDRDSVCLHDVVLTKSIEEAVLTNTASVPASEIPPGGTVLFRYKRRIPVAEPPAGGVAEDMELGPLVQLLMISKKLQYEQALEMAKDHVGKRRQQAKSGGGGGTVGNFQEVDYADVVVTRVVGPFAAGAKFDYMIYNDMIKEGVLYRKTPSRSCYALSFDSSKYAQAQLPKLVSQSDRVVLPEGVKRSEGGGR